jgi:hypothetical protein
MQTFSRQILNSLCWDSGTPQICSPYTILVNPASHLPSILQTETTSSVITLMEALPNSRIEARGILPKFTTAFLSGGMTTLVVLSAPTRAILRAPRLPGIIPPILVCTTNLMTCRHTYERSQCLYSDSKRAMHRPGKTGLLSHVLALLSISVCFQHQQATSSATGACLERSGLRFPQDIL